MKIDNLSYEETLTELEGILKELEDGDCTLNDSVDKFKKGIALYNHCNELLSKSEGEVKVVLENSNGDTTDEKFLVEV